VIADRALAVSAVTVALTLSGCFSEPQRSAPLPARVPPAGTPASPQMPAPWPQAIPDAVPRVEPRARLGNPPFYDVFGRRYYVLSSSSAYIERGVASWYGPGFHKVRTSTGELYDMYGMTAAHKTLPLPAYVRVINLQNGRSCVVRVNDRGPFVGNRIIDLSYTAAAKLDMLQNGTAMVEVRAIDPSSPTREPVFPVSGPGMPLLAAIPAAIAAPVTSAAMPVPAPPSAPPLAPAAAQTSTPPSPAAPAAPATAPSPTPSPRSAPARDAGLFVQAGAFANPANAERLATQLRGGGYGKVFVRDDFVAGRKMYRVRIGPVPDVPEFDRIVAALERAGVRDAHLALD
jgi:rare lipoprotein A